MLSHKIFQNLLSLSSIQAVSFLVQLFTLPYLLRTLGIQGFGTITIAQNLVSFFLVLVDFGFNITATQEIAKNRLSRSKLSETISLVYTCKLILLILGALVFALLVYFVPLFKSHLLLYLITFGMVVGQALTPLWLFQGLEKMHLIGYFIALPKVVFLMLTFFLIQNNSQLLLANGLYSAAALTSMLLSFGFIIRGLKLNLVFPEATKIRKAFHDGFPVFLSNFSINVYISSNLLVAGKFIPAEKLNLLAIPERLINISRQILNILFNSVFPTSCKLANQDNLKPFFSLMRKFFWILFCFFFMAGVVVFLYAPYQIGLNLESPSEELRFVLQMAAFVPLAIALNLPFYQTLIIFEKKKYFNLLFISGAVFNILTNCILSSYLEIKGTIITILLTEIFITFALFWQLKHIFSPLYFGILKPK